ncbi:hypothetical protein GCM10023081_19950 [Arthrobacter ginkgonis]|uniref:Uncharacterized protein n=1 Tax=Arthrobacter ginkgonis TaxID=1630594 RepID=A0ABP7CAI1_9MICC
MSRRKQRPLTVMADGTSRRGSAAADGYLDRRTIVEIGCTGRGSHRRIVIGSYDVWGEEPAGAADFAEDMKYVEERRTPDMHLVMDVDAHFTIPFRCDFCGRDMPKRQESLVYMLRKLKSGGVKFLDLSSLDAIGY